MTGANDEYSGEEEVIIFNQEVNEKDNPLLDDYGFSIITNMPVGDDNVWLAPCTIWPNPNWFNNGLGGEYRRDDPLAEKKALAHYKQVRISDAQKQLKRVLGFRDIPIENRKSWTEEAIEREASRETKRIKEAEEKTSVTKHPAFCSVAIFMSEKPSQKQIDFLKDRAYKFLKYSQTARFLTKGIEIEGFRLVDKTISTEENI